MQKKLSTLLFCPLLAFAPLCAKEAKPNKSEETAPKKEEKIDIEKISEAFGHLIGRNLESLGFEFDIDQIVKGMQDSVAGKPSPMDESECVQAISVVQEEAFQKLATKNLDEAESFLKSNKAEDGIISLEEDKVQYKVEALGNGEVVQEHFTPLIRYTGRFLDGKVFGSSQEDEMISLDEAIPGFSKAIVGMKEGEKRTVFIHPDLGYGTQGYLPPNSLLSFEIEVVKANAPQEESEALSHKSEEASPTQELAQPSQESIR